MAYERQQRIVLIVSDSEQHEIRIAAAQRKLSLSEFGRGAALALARGQLVATPQLPGMGEEPLPAWLTPTE